MPETNIPHVNRFFGASAFPAQQPSYSIDLNMNHVHPEELARIEQERQILDLARKNAAFTSKTLSGWAGGRSFSFKDCLVPLEAPPIDELEPSLEPNEYTKIANEATAQVNGTQQASCDYPHDPKNFRASNGHSAIDKAATADAYYKTTQRDPNFWPVYHAYMRLERALKHRLSDAEISYAETRYTELLQIYKANAFTRRHPKEDTPKKPPATPDYDLLNVHDKVTFRHGRPVSLHKRGKNVDRPYGLWLHEA